jgi:hypothetical protein
MMFRDFLSSSGLGQHLAAIPPPPQSVIYNVPQILFHVTLKDDTALVIKYNKCQGRSVPGRRDAKSRSVSNLQRVI